jgi:PucR family transcriptional regulator, purine catabolism regulatory protein
MALTVAEILELEVLRCAEAVVLAGTGGLAREVRWVHVTELPDIAYLLNGGELLLTTGMGIAKDAGAQQRFVRELAAAGCAGLVIELLRSYTEPPPALVEEADRCGLPLIGLRREARFVEITERVHVAIINEQYALLVKADAISREFTGLALRGGGLAPVLERLSRVVENPVVLEDGAHQVVDYAAHGLGVEELLQAWERHSRSGHAQRQPGVHTAAGDPGCAWIAIWLREELWGRLHVIQMGRRLDEIDRLALDRAAAGVGMALLSERDAANVADQARRSLISDVLRGQSGGREEVVHRARALGAEMGGKELAALVLGFPRHEQSVSGNGGTDVDRRRLSRLAVKEVRDSIRKCGAVGVAAVENDQVFAIVGLGSGERADGLLARIAREACEACERQEPGLGVVAGTSRETDSDSLHRVFEEADEAFRYGLRLGGGGVYRYADLGIHHLLVRLSEGPELAGFVESELAPLLEHDARSADPLLPTLRAYLSSAGNKSATARQLFIERRTLYRRLQRIGELLGTEESDHHRWLRLAVAIQGLDVMRERAPVHMR